eukprot:CAMPEP_0204569224 /NCGR_PEP_ID=MMETSP0661-20131031/37628_1 /ASSEMBLY_ACC=CAM_ASM_000606 /TAXON_ID=109239 /ORGANISM="Alexandrium margalefi, Strain AMGDE01CS-322" /LENGTH=48 /DNA_ID= /DNA_START= /DNA_END= /DNA_ORIENTATION=
MVHAGARAAAEGSSARGGRANSATHPTSPNWPEAVPGNVQREHWPDTA